VKVAVPAATAKATRAGAARLAASSLVVRVVDRGALHRLRVRLTLTRAAWTNVSLLRGKTQVKRWNAGVLRKGTTATAFRLPARLRHGAYTVRVTVRVAGQRATLARTARL
jgi:hypothetical protein